MFCTNFRDIFTYQWQHYFFPSMLKVSVCNDIPVSYFACNSMPQHTCAPLLSKTLDKPTPSAILKVLSKSFIIS